MTGSRISTSHVSGGNGVGTMNRNPGAASLLKIDSPLTAKQQHAAIHADRAVRKFAPHLANASLASWSEVPRLVQDRKGSWAILPMEIDPYRTKTGGYPFPAEVAKELSSLAKTGVVFDRLAVAHELAPSERSAKLLAKARSGSVEISVKEAHDLVGKLPAPAALKERVFGFDAGVRRSLAALTKGAAIAGAAALAPVAMVGDLDPIVFGVVGLEGSPRAGEPALFYPLAAWEW